MNNLSYAARERQYEQKLIDQWRDRILAVIDDQPKNIFDVMELANTWETRPTALAIEELEAEGLIRESYRNSGIFQDRYFVKINQP